MAHAGLASRQEHFACGLLAAGYMLGWRDQDFVDALGRSVDDATQARVAGMLSALRSADRQTRALALAPGAALLQTGLTHCAWTPTR